MTITKEVLGVLALLLVNMLLLATAWGKMSAVLSTVVRDVGDIKEAIGLKDGEAVFMRRAECSVLDGMTKATLTKFDAQLGVVEKTTQEHGARLTSVEREVRDLRAM